MAGVLVIGGGLAGCTVAQQLADDGVEVTLIEKSDAIGGKVRHYGCKATQKCNNCGLCLVGDLWEKVESHKKISIITQTELVDVLGNKGNFQVIIKTGNGAETLSEINSIVVSIGFNEFSSISSGSVEFQINDNIITGSQMEKLLSDRSKNEVFLKSPEKIAFIQCFGSRDYQQKSNYCSRVCCGYSTRAARVLRQYYPDCEMVFFYMDLQKVEQGEYFNCLSEENIEFIRCRPIRINNNKNNNKLASVLYEQPGEDGIIEREFDLIVLSEGIHPSKDVDTLSELCMLGIDDNGFLKYVIDGSKTGIYLAGCASGPKRIEEVHAEALVVAEQLITKG